MGIVWLFTRTAKCRLAIVGSLALAISASGCSRPTLYPVRGVVRLDGLPLPHVSVNYIPVGNGLAANGATDQSGRYTLETQNGFGVPPGDYLVVVKSTPPTSNDRSTSGNFATTPVSLPDHYAEPEASGMRIRVPAQGADAYDLELTTR